MPAQQRGARCFAAEYSVLAQLWEALSPDPCLRPYENDYRWLTQVYESVKPPSGNGKLLWHALGAKTVELINENVHVESVRDDVETLVMDADVLEEMVNDQKKAKEIEIKLIARLRKHGNSDLHRAGGAAGEDQRTARAGLPHQPGVPQAAAGDCARNRAGRKARRSGRAMAAGQGRADRTLPGDAHRDHAHHRRADRQRHRRHRAHVRFRGWQQTVAGEREVQKALRKTLLKYQLHEDQELFDKAYGYIKQYY